MIVINFEIGVEAHASMPIEMINQMQHRTMSRRKKTDAIFFSMNSDEQFSSDRLDCLEYEWNRT